MGRIELVCNLKVGPSIRLKHVIIRRRFPYGDTSTSEMLCRFVVVLESRDQSMLTSKLKVKSLFVKLLFHIFANASLVFASLSQDFSRKKLRTEFFLDQSPAEIATV